MGTCPARRQRQGPVGGLDRLREQKQSLPLGTLLLPAVQPADAGDGTALRDRLSACREAGADGFTFYNYGLLREHQLRAIGKARAAWV